MEPGPLPVDGDELVPFLKEKVGMTEITVLHDEWKALVPEWIEALKGAEYKCGHLVVGQRAIQQLQRLDDEIVVPRRRGAGCPGFGQVKDQGDREPGDPSWIRLDEGWIDGAT
jgi:hypothetical protein